MDEQKLISLMPEDSSLNEWQRCMKQAILSIQGSRLGYDTSWGSTNGNVHSGCTKDREHLGTRIMRKGNPAGSYCCGAVMEAFMVAWSLWKERADKDVTVEDMREMYANVFLFDRESKDTQYGAMGGLIKMSNNHDWLKVETSDEVDRFPFGAMVQMRFKEDPYAANSGHSVIALGHGVYDGNPCLVVWSSNYGHDGDFHYDPKSGLYTVINGDGQPSGHGPDYYVKDRVKDGYKRRFFGGWILP